MQVAIFTREGCGNCESVKAMMKEMDVQFEEHDAGDLLNPSADGYFDRHPDWRTTGVVDALALIQIDSTLPVVMIDSKAHTYQEALQKFESEQPNVIPVDFNHSVECEDGACVLAM